MTLAPPQIDTSVGDNWPSPSEDPELWKPVFDPFKVSSGLVSDFESPPVVPHGPPRPHGHLTLLYSRSTRQRYLENTFPKCHETDGPITREIVNQHGLLYTFKGSDESLKPLLLMAHQGEFS